MNFVFAQHLILYVFHCPCIGAFNVYVRTTKTREIALAHDPLLFLSSFLHSFPIYIVTASHLKCVGGNSIYRNNIDDKNDDE